MGPFDPLGRSEPLCHLPAVLLELKDRHGVIWAQIPTALPLLCANILIMYLTVYRF